MKKKHVVFRTTASVDEARRLLQAQTLSGSPNADNFAALMKDTLSRDRTPFRGEVEDNRFKVTRRVRGRRVRIQLDGTLEAKPDGSTEIRAAMSPPPTLVLSLIAGLMTLLIMSGGLALSGGPQWLLLLLAGLPIAGIASKLYDAETSRTFSALRDAIPAQPMAPVAPISASEEAPSVQSQVQLK
ncbi:MAG: hypothetical protein Q8L48_29450 [Archangium sp.]|nr:hypothetical protein [Archangium sp.]